MFSGHSAGERQDVVAPSLSRPRVAVPESETAEKWFLSGLRGPQDGQDFGSGLGAQGLLDALEPGSSAPRSGEHLPPPQEHAAAASRLRREAVGSFVFRAQCRRTARRCVAPQHYSSPQDRSSLVFGRSLCQPGRCSCQPPGCPMCLTLSLSATCCCARERDCRAICFIWMTGASGWTGVWRWTRCTRSAGCLGTLFECT